MKKIITAFATKSKNTVNLYKHLFPSTKSSTASVSESLFNIGKNQANKNNLNIMPHLPKSLFTSGHHETTKLFVKPENIAKIFASNSARNFTSKASDDYEKKREDFNKTVTFSISQYTLYKDFLKLNIFDPLFSIEKLLSHGVRGRCAIYDLVKMCKDHNFKPSYAQLRLLKGFHLVDDDNNVPEFIRKVLLSFVELEGSDIIVNYPIGLPTSVDQPCTAAKKFTSKSSDEPKTVILKDGYVLPELDVISTIWSLEELIGEGISGRKPLFELVKMCKYPNYVPYNVERSLKDLGLVDANNNVSELTRKIVLNAMEYKEPYFIVNSPIIKPSTSVDQPSASALSSKDKGGINLD